MVVLYFLYLSMFESIRSWLTKKISAGKTPEIKQEVIETFQIPFKKIDISQAKLDFLQISNKVYDFSNPNDINTAQKDWWTVGELIESIPMYEILWKKFYDTEIKWTSKDYVIFDEYWDSEFRSDFYENNDFIYFTNTIRDYSYSPVNCVAYTIEPSNDLFDIKFKFEKLDQAYNIIQSFFDRIDKNKEKNKN